MIRAAMLGLGWWGRKMVEVTAGSGHIRVTRAVTRRPHVAAEFADAHGLPVSADYGDALGDPEIDAVIIATPHAQHEEQIARAAEAGKHVFCEKPLTLDKAGAVRSVALCKAKGLVLGIGHERRFEPPMAEMLRAARAGELGTIFQFEANFSHDRFAEASAEHWRMSPEEALAGGMTATGIHLFDLATAILGEARQALTFCATLATGIPNGDTTAALVEYKSGATAYVAAMLATPFIGRCAVYGRKGWIEIRDKAHPEAPKGWILSKCMAEGQVEVTDAPAAEPVKDNLEAFAKAAEGQAPYPITPEEIIANTAVMEAVYESARTGRRVPLPFETDARRPVDLWLGE